MPEGRFRVNVVTVSRRLLDPGTDRGDALRVETEPVHPARVARVLNLEAPVHDHRQAAVLGNPRAFLVDHAELAPERAGVAPPRAPRNPGQCTGRAKDVPAAPRLRYPQRSGVPLLPGDLRLARI